MWCPLPCGMDQRFWTWRYLVLSSSRRHILHTGQLANNNLKVKYDNNISLKLPCVFLQRLYMCCIMYKFVILSFKAVGFIIPALGWILTLEQFILKKNKIISSDPAEQLYINISRPHTWHYYLLNITNLVKFTKTTKNHNEKIHTRNNFFFSHNLKYGPGLQSSITTLHLQLCWGPACTPILKWIMFINM